MPFYHYKSVLTSDKHRICPMNYDVVPSHPFPGTSFDTLAKVLGLETDYLRSEKLQIPSIAFEVPIDDLHSGKLDKRDTNVSLRVLRLRYEGSKMG
jgi:hypothetical protein